MKIAIALITLLIGLGTLVVTKWTWDVVKLNSPATNTPVLSFKDGELYFYIQSGQYIYVKIPVQAVGANAKDIKFRMWTKIREGNGGFDEKKYGGSVSRETNRYVS